MAATMQIQHRVHLDERSVQRVARESLRYSSRHRPRDEVAPEISTTAVHASVWRVARHLAGTDPLRIEIRTPWCVVVHNNRNWRTGR